MGIGPSPFPTKGSFSTHFANPHGDAVPTGDTDGAKSVCHQPLSKVHHPLDRAGPQTMVQG